MKLKLLFTAIMMSVATAVSVSAIGTVTGTEGMAGDFENQTTMLAVVPTDTINIEVKGVSGSLTLLSYKNGENPSPDNIQYIRQYTPDSDSSVKVSFKIRSIIDESDSSYEENGLYCVKLNDGNGEVKNLYYKVGVPESVKGEDGMEYFQRVDFEGKDVNKKDVTGMTSVSYKAEFSNAGGNIAEYGFRVKYGNNEKVQSNKFIDTEIGGSFSFGVTVYDIPTADADTEISLINVIPFVNYVETNNN